VREPNVEWGGSENWYLFAKYEADLAVDLTTLSVQQLSEVKKQFDEGYRLLLTYRANYQNSNTFHSLSRNYGRQGTSSWTV